MFKDPRVWTAIVAAGMGAWLIVPAVVPARPPRVAEELIPEIMYVCKETGEVFPRKLTAATLLSPTTGTPTLVPAIYDKKAKKWKPGPPLDVMQRRGLLKPAS